MRHPYLGATILTAALLLAGVALPNSTLSRAQQPVVPSPIVTVGEYPDGIPNLFRTVPFDEQYPDEAQQEERLAEVDSFDVEGPDGTIHGPCWIEVDEPSSHIYCSDGFTEES